MIKIGILTYHNTVNYGATLQAFALSSIINKLGAKCEIINYHCLNIEEREHLKFPKFQINLLNYLRDIKTYNAIKKKKRKIDEFVNKNIWVSKKEYFKENIKDANKEYDKFVVGSDMVFDTSKNGGDMTYYLNFADTNKRFSYAACLGVDKIEDKFFDSCKVELNKFKHISVREEQTKEYFLSFLNKKNVSVDLDPTLLFDSSFWERYEEQPEKKIKKGYVLLYFINKSMTEFEQAKKIANENNLDVYVLTSRKMKLNGCNVIYNASIGEFLYYIHHATLVITGSFHGMIFSMNYNTNFMYINKTGKTNKLENIAILTKSTDRKLTKDNIPKLEMDFSTINSIIDRERVKSLEYLKDVVSNEGEI